MQSYYGIDNAYVFHLHRPASAESLPRDVHFDVIMGVIKVLRDTAPSCWMADSDEALMLLMYGAGLRIAEACAISLPQAHAGIASGQIKVRGKVDKDRYLPLLDVVSRSIRKTLAGRSDTACQALFVTQRGKPLRPCYFLRRLRALHHEGRIPSSVTPHSFCHSCATHLPQNGVDIRHIQALLGHENISTTAHYARATEQKLLHDYLNVFG